MHTLTISLLSLTLAIGCNKEKETTMENDTAEENNTTEENDTSEETDTTEDTASDTGSVELTSLEADVMPIIIQSCGGCHTRTDAPFPAAVVNDVYYENKDDILVLVGSYILPGDPENSGFLAILTQDFPVGAGPTVMPPPEMGQPMSEVDVAIVAAWIEEGALDN